MQPATPRDNVHPAADPALVGRLEEIAARMRVDIIEMLARAGSGHPGGSLSAIDMVTALYFEVLRHDAKNPTWAESRPLRALQGPRGPCGLRGDGRGRLHREGRAHHLRQLGSKLQGHPVTSFVQGPGVEANTGSLGQGLSVAQGMAMAAKLDGASWRTYCMLGDGEMQEGQIWEALMSAPKFKLDNFVAILDYNKGQIDGPTDEVMNLEPLQEKLEAFNWHVIRIDGHDIGQFLAAIEEAKATSGKPTFIIADTVKGKGVSFMEHRIEWHGATPNPEQTQKALEELKR